MTLYGPPFSPSQNTSSDVSSMSSAPTSFQFDNPASGQTKILRRQRRMIPIQVFSQIMILGTLKVGSTLKYKRTNMHRWMITTFMSMTIRNPLLQGRLLLSQLTLHMKGNELFPFTQITSSHFSFHLLIHS